MIKKPTIVCLQLENHICIRKVYIRRHDQVRYLNIFWHVKWSYYFIIFCSFDPFSIGSEDSIEKEITRKICENVRY